MARVEDSDSEFGDDRKQALARLAALQRLEEQARSSDRPSMLKTIRAMIDAEGRSLQRDRDRDAEPSAGS